MAVGGPSSWSFLVDWLGTGTFTEEADRLRAEQRVVIRRGRGSEADDVQPATLSATWDNTSGRYTADNPLSPLWPSVRPDRPARFSVTRLRESDGLPVSSVRWRGRLSVGAPELPGGEIARAEVSVDGADVLGDLSRRVMRCDFVERWLTTSGFQDTDVFDLPAATRPSTYTSLSAVGGTGRVVYSGSRAGRAEAVADPPGVVLDSAVALTRGGGDVGPVIRLDTGLSSVQEIVIPMSVRDRTAAGGPDKWLAAGYDASGTSLWSVRLRDNGGQTDINLYTGSGAFALTLDFGFAPGSGSTAAGSEDWRALYLNHNGVNQIAAMYSPGVSGPAFLVSLDIRRTRTVVLGGDAGRLTPGKQRSCASATFGAVAISQGAGPHIDYLGSAATEPGLTRLTDLSAYVPFSRTVVGARAPTVWLKRLSGRTAYEAVAELARTTGAVARSSVTADGSLRWLSADALRLPAVRMTVDAERDLDGTDGFAWRQGERPSSVTASWPGGEVTVTDPSRLRTDDTVETTAADETGARDVASARVYSSGRLRLTRLDVDLATSSSDLWAAAVALEVGDRVRVVLGAAGSPLVAHYGATYVDVYVVGWTETYGEGHARWEIDTVPADDPVEGQFDDSDRGRFGADPGSMTVTGGTCVGTVAAGTLVVTTTSGRPTWSVSAADYPLELDWHGEQVTIGAAPASATSPQTLTVTARGTGPSVARSHLAGEPCDVALPAAYSW